jgi:regulatory protein
MAGRRRRAGSRDGHDQRVPGPAADLAPDADHTSDADPAAVARAIVLRQLTSGPRSRAQLAQALTRRGVPDDVAAAVLDRFEEVDLVDDTEFARQWVQTRQAGRGLARRALAHELRHRGIDEEITRQAVGAIGDGDELEAARELVLRRQRAMTGDEPARRVRRLAGILARKGYSGTVAMRAIRECAAEASLSTEVADEEASDQEALDEESNG